MSNPILSYIGIIALLLLVTPSLAQGPLPSGKMYWTDRGTSQIFRANFDGSQQEEILGDDDIPGQNLLRGLVIDHAEQHLYFCGSLQRKIFRASLIGDLDVREVVTEDLRFPGDITFDPIARKLYWCDSSRNLIRRANPDGTDIEDLIEASGPYFLTLDLSSGKIYWGDIGHGPVGTIYRANLSDGSNIENLVDNIDGQVRGVQLDLAEGKIYWVSRNRGKIQRRDIEGADVEDLYIGLDTPHGLTIDLHARKLYWADTGTNSGEGFGGDTISRGSMDGSTPMEILTTAETRREPWDVILDTRAAGWDQWVARHFREDTIATDMSPAADPDKDTHSNALEFALATNPLVSDADKGRPTIVEVDGFPAVQFRQTAASVSGPKIWIEASQDLKDWTTQGLEEQPPVESVSGEFRYTVVKSPWPNAYLRLQVEVAVP